ncbi:metallophosphoesterase [Lapillicoccus jejuensis]|uniref:Calcineurin-like phosphoesterase family protein n=1 Tax=Lapillicoccus jejuensis TaxID=402171 RepID=A0A542E3D9_9MICO|nr:metallophosphoesterase [Lapillicoccus jejuensis]TQJ09764.1 calcineurin-like phosphoesterase family protein [Lapillicoccus jejuensis]
MPLFVVSDPHGHRDELAAALRDAGLLDAADRWVGADARLRVLGDFFDRGPDGVGAVELVMRLEREAVGAGGSTSAVLGNHEVLALGMWRYGVRAAPGADGGSFGESWVLNGGNPIDQGRLTAEHVTWLSALPPLALEDGWLLMHSDTDAYLELGHSVAAVNAAVAAALDGDFAEHWEVWRRLTDRYAFVTPGSGVTTARGILRTYGAARLVHGHSIIATIQPDAPSPAATAGPWAYADGLALAVDGGLYAGGPLLVVELEPAVEGSAP